jgi:hypothetical protein
MLKTAIRALLKAFKLEDVVQRSLSSCRRPRPKILIFRFAGTDITGIMIQKGTAVRLFST